jgi:hypothetical protein
MFPLWQQVLSLFGVEISETCHVECVDLQIPDLDFFGEGLIIESGKIVGKAAIIDIDDEHLESTDGTLPLGYVV